MFRRRQQVSQVGIVLTMIALAVGISGCLPDGTQMPESPLLSSIERKSGLIVYSGSDGNIYTINQAGGRQTALTTDGGFNEDEGISVLYEQPTWSPDSERVAFVRVEIAGQALSEARVMAASPEGEDTSQLFTADSQLPIYLYWSPNGENLSFIATSDPSGSNLILNMVPASGGEPQVLDAGRPYYWSWAPDSDYMLVHVGNDSPDGRISFLNVSDGVYEDRLDLVPGSFQAPAWSPDGASLLMAIEGQENNVLALTDTSGQVQQELTDYEHTIAFGWSPDGKRLAYINSAIERIQGALGDLTILEPGSDKGPVTPEDNPPVLAFFWSPDSRKLAYFVPLLVNPESLQEASTGEDIPVQSGGDDDESEDSPMLFLQLFVLNTRTGDNRSVTTFQPTNSFFTVLLNFDQYLRSSTIWSPDSENLVISALNQEGDPGIWVVPASGNLESRFLTLGRLAFWSWE